MIVNQHSEQRLDYRLGLQMLKGKVYRSEVRDEIKLDLQTLEARLLENLNDERRFGQSETLRTERARIVRGLARLSLKLNLDFNALCQGHVSEPVAVSDTVKLSNAELKRSYNLGQELEKAGYKFEAAAKYWKVWLAQPNFRDVASRLADLEQSQKEIYVGRQDELDKLMHELDQSVSGTSSVVFLRGEPGTGKTALAQEFLWKAQAKYDDLVYTVGSCSARSGIGEPYLPFREALYLLCGEIERQLSQASISITNALRLSRIAPVSIQVIFEHAPNLLNSLLPMSFLDIQRREYGVGEIRPPGLATTRRPPGLAASAFADNTRVALTLDYLLALRSISAYSPLVIFLDDLQWSDSASINLLFYLATKLRDAPVLLIGAFRTSEAATVNSSLLDSILDIKIRLPETLEIDLDKTDEQFVSLLVTAQYPNNRFASDFASKMQSHTGGNALFVAELFQYFEETGKFFQDDQGVWMFKDELKISELPPKVESVIEKRIAGLETDLRKILDAASVEGDEFTAQVVAQICGIEERELLERLSDELEQGWHLIAASRSVTYRQKRLYMYRFKHALIRMYIYEHLSTVERELLHQDIALFLESMYETELERISSVLAEHFHRANMPEREADYRLMAANEAARIGARETAIYHLDRLEETLSEAPIPPTSKFELFKRLYGLRGNFYALVSSLEKAKEDFRRLESIAKDGGDLCELARALCGYGILERSRGNFESALEFAFRAETVASVEQCPDIVAECKLLVAKTYKDLAKYDQTIKYAEMARSLYAKLKDSTGILDSSSQVAYGYYAQGQYDEAEAIWLENLSHARDIGNVPAEEDACFCLGFLNWRRGLYQRAKRFFTSALELARQMNDQREAAYCLNDLGFVETSLGNYGQAQSLLKEALSTFEGLGDKKGQSWALGNLGDALTQAGNFEDAMVHLEKNRALAREINLESDVAESSRRFSWAYLGLHQLSESYRYAQLALQEAEKIDRRDFVGMAYLVLGEISAAAEFSSIAHPLAGIQDPEDYFALSVVIARETRSTVEEAKSLRAWGEYLVKSPGLSLQEKGKDLIQQADTLQQRLRQLDLRD